MDTSVGAGSRPKVAAVATPAAEDQPESTVGVTSSDAAEDGAGGTGPFGVDPRAEGGSGIEADTLLAVRHGPHEGLDRIVLDLGAGEEAAGTVLRWTLDAQMDDGLLRVNLPSANAPPSRTVASATGCWGASTSYARPRGTCSWTSSSERPSATACWS